MRTTKIDRAAAETLRAEIEAAARAIAAARGLSALITKCTVDANGAYVHITTQLALVNDDGIARTREAEAFVVLAREYGIADHVALGSEFGRGEYRVCGLTPRGTKTPVLATRKSDGQVYKFSVEVVNRAVARNATSAISA